MKAPRLSVVVAAMNTERDILASVRTASPDTINQRIAVLDECISRLEPNGAPAKSETAPKPRTRKAKADVEVTA